MAQTVHISRCRFFGVLLTLPPRWVILEVVYYATQVITKKIATSTQALKCLGCTLLGSYVPQIQLPCNCAHSSQSARLRRGLVVTTVWLFKPRSHGRKKEAARARNGAPLLWWSMHAQHPAVHCGCTIEGITNLLFACRAARCPRSRSRTCACAAAHPRASVHRPTARH